MFRDIALIGTKLGMTHMYIGNKMTPVTLLHVLPNTLVNKVVHANGKQKVLITGGKEVKDSKVNKPQLKNLEKLNIKPQQFSKEFTVKNEFSALNVGQTFEIGDYLLNTFVDIRAVSKGKGFQGGMKRWGFAGLNASHGVSLTHRSIGSTGNRSLPGRVFPGKKMPGHMGARNVCVQNVQILHIDIENNIIAVKGSIPGGENGQLFIKTAVKKNNHSESALNNVVL